MRESVVVDRLVWGSSVLSFRGFVIMSSNPLPPGCQNALINGINVKRMDFLGSPVFRLGSDTHDVTITGTTYSVPREIGCESVDMVHQSESTLILGTEDDYKRSFSVAMSASLSSVEYNASMDSSFAYHGELFTQSDTTYALNTCKKTLYEIRRNTYTLESAFSAALAGLSSTTTQDDFSAFFDLYGTHYLEEGYFGGFYSMETSISDDVTKSSSSEDIKLSLSMGFSGVVTSGKLSVDTAYSSSTFLSNHKSQTSVKFEWIGGASNNDVQKFLDSVNASPVLLIDLNDASTKPTLQPISKLAGSSARPAIESAIRRYLGVSDVGLHMPVDAAWSDNDGVTVQAGGAGFAVGGRFMSVDGDRGSIRIVTSIAEAAGYMHVWSTNDHRVSCQSVCLPVAGSDTYRVEFAKTAGTPTGISAFVPFDGTFGDWSRVETGNEYHVIGPYQTDAFVVFSLKAGADGNRGEMSIKDHQLDQIRAYISVHQNDGTDEHFLAQTACVPLPKGRSLAVNFWPSSGQPTGFVYVLPMTDSRFTLGPREVRQSNVLLRTDTAGFLYGFVRANRDGDCSSAKVYIGSDAMSSSPGLPYACASMHYYTRDDRWQQCASLMLPIAAGVDYKIVVDRATGSPEDFWSWTPLVSS